MAKPEYKVQNVFTAFFWDGNPAKSTRLHFIIVDTERFGLEKGLPDQDIMDLVYLDN